MKRTELNRAERCTIEDLLHRRVNLSCCRIVAKRGSRAMRKRRQHDVPFATFGPQPT